MDWRGAYVTLASNHRWTAQFKSKRSIDGRNASTSEEIQDDRKVRYRWISRRSILKGAAALGAASAFPAIITRRALAAGNITVVNSIRSLSNPYHATWNKGGAAFAKSVGVDYVTLVTEGNSEKGIADIKAILAKTGGNCVINVDPNDSPDARPIVQACKDAGPLS